MYAHRRVMPSHCVLRGNEQLLNICMRADRNLTRSASTRTIRMPVPTRNSLLSRTASLLLSSSNSSMSQEPRPPPRYSYELLTGTQELPSSSARSRHFRHHSRSSGCCLPACLLACLLLARSLHATITHFTRIIKPVSKYLLGLPTYPLGCISVHSFQHRILEARVEDTQFANVTGKSATFETGRWKNWKRAGTSSTTPELDEGGGESKL